MSEFEKGQEVRLATEFRDNYAIQQAPSPIRFIYGSFISGKFAAVQDAEGLVHYIPASFIEAVEAGDPDGD